MAAVIVTDSGTASDGISGLVSQLSLLDSGAGSDTVSQILISISINDLAIGNDNVPQTDLGYGSDTVSQILVSLSINDLVAGIDSISPIQAYFTLPDSAIGSENLPIQVYLIVPVDSGQGVDEVQILVSLSINDLVVGSDNVPQTDLGYGTDEIAQILVNSSVNDLVTGSDSIDSIQVYFTLPDLGYGIDEISQILCWMSMIDFDIAIDNIKVGREIVSLDVSFKKPTMKITFKETQPY